MVRAVVGLREDGSRLGLWVVASRSGLLRPQLSAALDPVRLVLVLRHGCTVPTERSPGRRSPTSTSAARTRTWTATTPASSPSSEFTPPPAPPTRVSTPAHRIHTA